MKFLVLSDIHGEISILDKLDDEFKKADVVLFAGDFAQFGNIETGLPTLQALMKKHETIYAITGNCDEPTFVETLEEYDVCVEKSLVYYEGLFFSGSGGALTFTGTTPYERSEEELVSDLRVVSELEDKANSILLIHQPPKDTKLDKITVGAHVGSETIKTFIEENQPLVVVTGHIHESFAVDTIGRTVVINPGALAEGRYATLEVEKVNGEFVVTKSELCEVK